jgi:hypothetical protein
LAKETQAPLVKDVRFLSGTVKENWLNHVRFSHISDITDQAGFGLIFQAPQSQMSVCFAGYFVT